MADSFWPRGFWPFFFWLCTLHVPTKIKNQKLISIRVFFFFVSEKFEKYTFTCFSSSFIRYVLILWTCQHNRLWNGQACFVGAKFIDSKERVKQLHKFRCFKIWSVIWFNLQQCWRYWPTLPYWIAGSAIWLYELHIQNRMSCQFSKEACRLIM